MSVAQPVLGRTLRASLSQPGNERRQSAVSEPETGELLLRCRRSTPAFAPNDMRGDSVLSWKENRPPLTRW